MAFGLNLNYSDYYKFYVSLGVVLILVAFVFEIGYWLHAYKALEDCFLLLENYSLTIKDYASVLSPDELRNKGLDKNYTKGYYDLLSGYFKMGSTCLEAIGNRLTVIASLERAIHGAAFVLFVTGLYCFISGNIKWKETYEAQHETELLTREILKLDKQLRELQLLQEKEKLNKMNGKNH